jgi:signal transduction histidine kinase
MKPLHILHVEDSPEDSELVEHLLKDNGLDCKTRRVETRRQLLEALKDSEYDIVLSDCNLPHFSGLQALELVHALRPQVPFIFVSGTIGEEAAIHSLQDGATDYVLKHRLSRLVPAVRRAMAEAEEKAMRHAMERRLRQTRQLEAIGTLAGGLAHDFNNLLQIFKMNIALLPMHADRPDEIVKIAGLLDKAVDRGTDLMQELLVFGRKTEAHLSSIDVSDRINETAEILRGALPKNINLVFQLDGDLPPLFADPGQLDRILTNLVVNARDAMPHGGSITIAAETVRFDSNTPLSWQMDDVPYLCIKLADTGTGMDEATRVHAFEPFFTTKPRGKGTGLGLSVVFGLMQVHSGLIDLQSKPGEGTVVSLFFPLPQNSKVAPDKIKKMAPIQFLGGHAEPASSL